MYDFVVAGGGIVGLASAYKILEKKPNAKVLVLEKEKEVAQHQTGHNSGVIHSGIYYKPGSLKANNCIQGYNMLLDFCQENNIPYELCGKIIVATSKEELTALENIWVRGNQNGLTNLKKINSTAELKEYEPHVNGIAGIHVPQTGIISYTQVCLTLKKLILQKGGEVHCQEKLLKLTEKPGHVEIVTEKNSLQTKVFVNCGGLYSDKIAKMTHPQLNLKIVPFRGEYYELKAEKQYLVKNLIYPVPDPNFPFLGVHFTRMIGGGIEAGPNAVLAFSREGYTKSRIRFGELFETLFFRGFQKVAFKYWKTGLGEMYRSFSKAAFTKALQKLMPEIQKSDLVPGGAGVRAQACDRNGGLLDDFMILETAKVVNVCNAPSPAATSSLSIGNTVSDMALKKWMA